MKAPDELYQQFFKCDEDGRPSPLFKIACKDTPRREIINPDHSALVLPYLKQVDAWISSSLARVSQLSGIEFVALFEECEKVNKHAHQVLAQAFYLDTADRNSWLTIKQVINAAPNGISLSSSEHRLKELMKFIDLDAYVDKKAQAVTASTDHSHSP